MFEFMNLVKILYLAFSLSYESEKDVAVARLLLPRGLGFQERWEEDGKACGG
jgi:hypothetical protein